MKSTNQPIRINMSLSKLMSDYYHLIEQVEDSKEARNSLAGIVKLAIYDIQNEGLDLTPEELEKRISNHINDFLDVAKKTNVA
jgi:hypothetical protein